MRHGLIHTKFLRGLRALHRNESGASLVLIAVSMGLVMTTVGIAFEMSRYSSAKSRFNNGVDQALLAAAAANASDPTAYATQYLNTNLKGTAHDIKVTGFEVTTNAEKTSWVANAKGELHSTIGGAFGLRHMKLNHLARVEWDNTSTTEIVAMVDVSGTMCANFQRTRNASGGADSIDFVPDRTCRKLSMMQEGLTNIANIGLGYSAAGAGGRPAYRIGILPFTYKMRLAHPEKVPSFMLDAERAAGYGDDYYTNLADAELNAGPLPAVVPLTPIYGASDKASIVEKIKQITGNPEATFQRAAWKRSSLAAQMSAMMLDPNHTDMFGGDTPAAFNDNSTKKVVIMMTDSANLGCCFTNWPENNFRNHYIYSYNPDHQHLVGDANRPGICQQMKDAGIEIYTILLDVDRSDMDARGAEIVDSFSHCASSPAHAFEVPYNDTERLKQAYGSVGRAIAKLRLAE